MVVTTVEGREVEIERQFNGRAEKIRVGYGIGGMGGILSVGLKILKNIKCFIDMLLLIFVIFFLLLFDILRGLLVY